MDADAARHVLTRVVCPVRDAEVQRAYGGLGTGMGAYEAGPSSGSDTEHYWTERRNVRRRED